MASFAREIGQENLSVSHSSETKAKLLPYTLLQCFANQTHILLNNYNQGSQLLKYLFARGWNLCCGSGQCSEGEVVSICVRHLQVNILALDRIADSKSWVILE